MQQALRRPITLVLAGALVLQLALATLPTFAADADLFRAWGVFIARIGPENLYHTSLFHAYAPGYMYFLWFLGRLDDAFGLSISQWNYALKLPSIVANLGSAYLLYRFLAGEGSRRRIGAAALYLLFPATLLIGPIWGQNDSVLVFFLMLTLYFLAKDRPVSAALAYSAGFIVKPQAVAALPFLLFWVVRDHPPQLRRIGAHLRVPVLPSVWLRMAGSSLVLILVVIYPFFPSHVPWRPFVGLAHQVGSASNAWPLNSFFAFNFWSVLGKDIADRCDSAQCLNPTISHVTYITHGTEFLGLSTRFWGWALFAVAIATVLYVLRNARGPAFLALGTSLSILAFYLFTTRMHERYLFPFFLPFLAACVLFRSRALWAVFGLLGAVHFLNLYLVYTEPHHLRYQALYDWLRDPNLWGTGTETAQLLSAIILAGLFVLVPTAYRLANRSPEAT